jgi:hypothetical protein
MQISEKDLEDLKANQTTQDIPTSSIKELFRDAKGRSSKVFDAEYGYGVEGAYDALVMHFFPPGYAADNTVRWGGEAGWTAFRDRLEPVLLAHFASTSLSGTYTEELESFCVIVHPVPQVPDLEMLIEKFFAALEA